VVQFHDLAVSQLGKHPVPTEQNAGWKPKLVCIIWRREKSLAPARI
jgi:hypothetical protein